MRQQGARTRPDPLASYPVSAANLADVVALLDRRYPPEQAEPWDVVGTVCGENRPVRKVLFAVDLTDAVVGEAVNWQADLLITHHPPLFRAVHSLDSPKGRLVQRLIRGGCALHTVHTNADAAPDGPPETLARALGITPVPLAPLPLPDLDKHVVFVPDDDAAAVLDAMAQAGAGELGAYRRCAWRTTGTGTFTPQPGAKPAVGEIGVPAEVTETRIEMIAARPLRSQVIAAMRSAHPYEEPAFDVLELAAVPGRVGPGRVGELAAPVALRDFAALVARTLPPTAQGVRVAGDLDAAVRRVAVVTGSGDSFLDAARAAGADVYVTGDLRHHPALELRERVGQEAAAAGRPHADGRPFLVDVAHSAGEQLWLAHAAHLLADDVAGFGATVDVRVAELTDPWTARIPGGDA